MRFHGRQYRPTPSFRRPRPGGRLNASRPGAPTPAWQARALARPPSCAVHRVIRRVCARRRVPARPAPTVSKSRERATTTKSARNQAVARSDPTRRPVGLLRGGLARGSHPDGAAVNPQHGGVRCASFRVVSLQCSSAWRSRAGGVRPDVRRRPRPSPRRPLPRRRRQAPARVPLSIARGVVKSIADSRLVIDLGQGAVGAGGRPEHVHAGFRDADPAARAARSRRRTCGSATR